MGSERESDFLMASAAARCAECDIAMRRWESKIREVGMRGGKDSMMLVSHTSVDTIVALCGEVRT
jgi:hypothetical protein